ncbi:MAG: endonuclease [Candidatus Thiodiazotropha sp.]|jgi:endonuclease I
MKWMIRMTGLISILSFPLSATPLSEGVPVDGLSATSGQRLAFELEVPANARNLNIAISGGTGDADLYVKAYSVPTESDYECRPYLVGNAERCLFASPSVATYHVMIKAYQGFSQLRLLASYILDGSTQETQVLLNGVVLHGLTQAAGEETQYHIPVPEGATDLSVKISGGTGDADLYVRSGSEATTSNYDCRPYLTGNQEQCDFAIPVAGDYYILLRAYAGYSGVSLSAVYSSASPGNEGDGEVTWTGFDSYYADAIGQTGITLMAALTEAASRHQVHLSYSQVWEALKYTDEDPSNPNNVLLIYTGRSQAKTYNASGNGDPDAWNREHTWPKSHGFPDSRDWAYTDIHQLRPADVSVNSTRGNKDFDTGGSEISEAPGNYTDVDSFEPRDAVKGDIARMMFYMDIRYNGQSNTGTDDLNLVDYSGTSGANLGDLCTLFQWHNQDPVSAQEVARHARIVERQGNRNPFVDNPAWVNEIWGARCE